MTSQLPFGWVCFSNSPRRSPSVRAGCGLNCLSAGSVSLTRIEIAGRRGRLIVSQLPFGWVCFSNRQNTRLALAIRFLSQLPFGWVCFSNEWNFADKRKDAWGCLNCLSAGSVSLTVRDVAHEWQERVPSQLPFSWVCFSDKPRHANARQ